MERRALVPLTRWLKSLLFSARPLPTKFLNIGEGSTMNSLHHVTLGSRSWPTSSALWFPNMFWFTRASTTPRYNQSKPLATLYFHAWARKLYVRSALYCKNEAEVTSRRLLHGVRTGCRSSMHPAPDTISRPAHSSTTNDRYQCQSPVLGVDLQARVRTATCPRSQSRPPSTRR